jgi:hypothetical protein
MAKVSKRKLQPLPAEQDKMILSLEEHIQVATKPLEIENSKLLMAVKEQELANLLLENKLLINKIEKVKQELAEAHLKYKNEKTRYEAAIGVIMSNHGLKNNKFGYNNDTGEIIPYFTEE